MIRINLDTVKKYRNSREWRPVCRATFGDYQRTGDGALIAPLCRDLLEAGFDPAEVVEVRRGETVCFTPATLAQWASGKTGRGEQPEHLKREVNE